MEFIEKEQRFLKEKEQYLKEVELRLLKAGADLSKMPKRNYSEITEDDYRGGDENSDDDHF